MLQRGLRPRQTESRDLAKPPLGVAHEAADAEVRDAYLRKVKEFPPDRAPVEFERVRDAYDALRDPRRRARFALVPEAPKASLLSVIDGPLQRSHIGPAPWLAALREA